MTTARKILSNTASQFLGRLVMALLSIITLKLITTYLGKAGYGEYTTIYEFIGFFAIFADMGIYTIAVHEMSRDESQRAYVIGNIMGLRALLSFVMMFLAIVAAFLLPQYQGGNIPYGVVIVSITTFLNLLFGTVVSIFQIYYKMHYSAFTLVLGKIAMLIYITTAVYLDLGFYHLLIAGVLGTAIMYSLTSYLARKLISFQYRFDFDFWKKVIFRAAPGGIALILNNIYFRVDVVLLSLCLPTKTAFLQTGVYGVAIRILDMLMVIPVFFMNSVLPVLTKNYKENQEKFFEVIQLAFEFLIITGLPIVVGGLMLSRGIIAFVSSEEFLSGPNFYGSDFVVNVLLIALFFTFLNFLFGFLFIVDRKPLKLLTITASAVVFNIVSSIFFIPEFGLVATVITSVISQAMILIFTFILSRKYLKFSLHLKNTFKSIFAALCMWAALYAVLFLIGNKYSWIVAGFIGCLVYAGVLFMTGVIDKDRLKMLKK